jgi:hypothetical protein
LFVDTVRWVWGRIGLSAYGRVVVRGGGRESARLNP